VGSKFFVRKQYFYNSGLGNKSWIFFTEFVEVFSPVSLEKDKINDW